MASTLTPEQLEHFKQRLEASRAERLEEIRQKLRGTDNEHFVDLVGSAHDVADESVADLLSDLGILEVDRLVREVNDIEKALLRMANGTYGLCMDCGGTIDYRRLEAYPTAERCQRCQERYDSTHSTPDRASM